MNSRGILNTKTLDNEILREAVKSPARATSEDGGRSDLGRYQNADG